MNFFFLAKNKFHHLKISNNDFFNEAFILNNEFVQNTTVDNGDGTVSQIVNVDVKSDLTKIIAHAKESTVGIAVYLRNTQAGSGSGVVYKKDNNNVYVITNHHVIEGASSIEVIFSNGKAVKAKESTGKRLTPGLHNAEFVRVEKTIINTKNGDAMDAMSLVVNIDGYGEYTQNFFEPTSNERTSGTYGDNPSQVEQFMIAIRIILEALNPIYFEALPLSLEEIFITNPAVMKGFVFPQRVSDKEREAACKELLMKYGIFADGETSGAYAAAKKHNEASDSEASTVVLVARDHPAFSANEIKHWCGEAPEMPEHIKILQENIKPKKIIKPVKEELVEILKEVK